MKELKILVEELVESYPITEKDEEYFKTLEVASVFDKLKSLGANQEFFEGAVYGLDQLIMSIMTRPDLPPDRAVEFCIKFFLIGLSNIRKDSGKESEPLEEVFESYWKPEEE